MARNSSFAAAGEINAPKKGKVFGCTSQPLGRNRWS